MDGSRRPRTAMRDTLAEARASWKIAEPAVDCQYVHMWLKQSHEATSKSGLRRALPLPVAPVRMMDDMVNRQKAVPVEELG